MESSSLRCVVRRGRQKRGSETGRPFKATAENDGGYMDMGIVHCEASLTCIIKNNQTQVVIWRFDRATSLIREGAC